jgi:ATP-binding cassette, subfamily B, bacterial
MASSLWLVAVLLLAAVPAFAAEVSFSMAGFRLRNWRTPEARRLNYLKLVMANDEYAKEVKLFGLGKLLLGRYKGLAENVYLEDRKLAVRRTAWGVPLSLLSTLAFYGCYALIVLSTVGGRLSLGDMTLYLIAFRQGQQAFQSILTAVGDMYEHTLYMSNLFEFLRMPAGSDNGARTLSAASPASGRIVLSNDLTGPAKAVRAVHPRCRTPPACPW